MKIEGPKRAQQSDKSKKKDKVSSGDGTFGQMVADSAGQKEETGASRSIAQVDALLAVQATENPTERAARRRMTARAESLLEELEGLRAGLLTGQLTVGQVIDVADVVASHREKVMDPRLTAILDEIDLRAQIEIAKLRVAMERQSAG